LLAADWDGRNLPPRGSPGYLMGFGVDKLRLWRMTVDWSARAKFTISQVPKGIAVKWFDPACTDANGCLFECIPQKDASGFIGPLSDRLMNRLSYRNFGKRESLFVTHTVDANRQTASSWYELSHALAPNGWIAAGEFAVAQQQTYEPDRTSRWLSSVAADRNGSVLLTFSASSTEMHPSLRYAGRMQCAEGTQPCTSDPTGTLSEEGSIRESAFSAPLVGDPGEERIRWGDYTSITLDPADDCTFWTTGEYLGPTLPADLYAPPGEKIAAGWNTLVAAIRFPNCK
jgi:hypothetical protein